MTRRKVLVYGDVNLNYRDGSGVWLESLLECLLRTDCDVHVLLKADVAEKERLSTLKSLRGLTVHTPFDDRASGVAGMKPREAASRIAVLDRRHKFSIILSRGYDISAQLAVSGRFTGRLWPYLTEGPAFSFSPTDHQRGVLDKIAKQARRIFLQTEEARSIVESLNDGMTGKTLLMPPIVPDSAFDMYLPSPEAYDSPPRATGNLRLVYAGKFARRWNTLEMVSLPTRLAEVGVAAEIDMVGDKFQGTGPDASWLEEMRSASERNNFGVVWRGGLSRSRTLEIVRDADIGLCWRDSELDSSAEISTKMLECAAVGTPPLLNRTTMHEQLFGSDYPLFVDDDDVIGPIRAVVDNPELLVYARDRAYRAVQSYSMTNASNRFKTYFARAEADPESSGILRLSNRKRRVVVAGHDFKFASDLIEMLQQRDDIELRIDKWDRLAVHNKEESLAAAHWADIVICEWAGPNAVFYAEHAPETTKLLVRFHGFEVRGKWLESLDPTRVDCFVFVSDFYRRQILRTLGWPEGRTTVIYNTIDSADLDRPKLSDAPFHIGMAGFVPYLKRPDRAVDLLRHLLNADDRFYLHIRGRVPWQYPWEWQKLAGQDAYREFFRKVSNDSLLRQRVIFEPFGPDMGNWFRRIGWMVSPSTRETFHLAPVEGMASGAPALVWDRDGAKEIFGHDLVRSTAEELADVVLSHRDKGSWLELGQQAKARANQYDYMSARERWLELLSLPRGAEPPLHGVSVLPEDAEPQNRAEAIVALQRAFKNFGSERAFEVLETYPEWLKSEAVTVASWRRLEQWANAVTAEMPAVSPLYEQRERVVLAVGKAQEFTFPGVLSVNVTAASSVGTPDHDVMINADRFTRAAIRERVTAIVAGGSLTTVLAASLAAKRLGIPWFASQIESPEDGFGSVGQLLCTLYERVSLTAENADGLVRKLDKLRNIARPPGKVRKISDLRLGLIADEFTCRTVSSAVDVVMLRRKAWQAQLEGLDAVLIESAWEGPDHEWFHGVAYHGEQEAADLWGLIDTCRERSIPVLFWNKEDPVHFRSFALAAGRADHVFTTDADRLPAYLSQPNQNQTASSISFFVEPSIHNPKPTSRKYSPTAAFAGTYYGARYPKRSEELSMILGVAAEFGLTIYDRQHGLPHSPYQLPDELKKYSVGSVPYEQILDTYKAHPVNINVNSVADSPSMFSRRVVEIAACGSAVASGAGRGVAEVLGRDFPVLETAKAWRDQLTTWDNDESARLTTVWAQLRTVFRSHRADQALVLMLRTAGLDVDPVALPRYGLLVTQKSEIEAASEQSLAPVLVTRDEGLVDLARSLGLQVVADIHDIEWVGHIRLFRFQSA